MPLCSCGCGQDGPGRTRRGHHKRRAYPEPIRDPDSGCPAPETFQHPPGKHLPGVLR